MTEKTEASLSAQSPGFFLLLTARLYVVPRALEYLDFVAIRVLNEVEPGENLLAAFEFLHGRGIDAESGHPGMLIFQLCNCHGDVAVPVTVRIRRLAAFIPCQFNVEIVLLVAKID